MSTTTTEAELSPPKMSFDVWLPKTEAEWIAWFGGYQTDERTRRERRLEFAKETLTVVKEGVGVVPFEPFDSQVDYWLNRADKNVVNKGREEGLSAVIVADHCVEQAFDGGSNMIVADKEDTTLNLMRFYAHRFISDMKERWPSLIPKHSITSSSIVFFNDGLPYRVIEAFTATGTVASSFRFSRALFDELGKWPRNIEEQMYWSADGALRKGARIDAPSTPFGIGGLFAELWMEAESRGFKRMDYTVYGIQRRGLVGNPDHDLAWFREKWQKKGDVGMAQEHLGDFLQSGTPWINAVYLPDPVEPMLMGERDPALHGTPDLLVWSNPQPGRRYFSFTDTAEGIEDGNYNATTGWDLESGEQVYELVDRLPPDAHARRHDGVARLYRGAHYFELNNTSGGQYQAEASKLGTPGLFACKTTPTNRPQMVEEGERAVRLAEIRPKSRALLDQCRAVSWGKGDKCKAPKNHHDDIWITLLGFAYYGARLKGGDSKVYAGGRPSIETEAWL